MAARLIKLEQLEPSPSIMDSIVLFFLFKLYGRRLFIIIIVYLIEASRGAGVQSGTVNATGCGFE